MSQVRCKMICNTKTETLSGNEATYSVKLHPVADGSEENKKFYRWTPQGQIELTVINPSAAAQFQVGKSYYVDFTLAD